MNDVIPNGVWPTMITPFTDSNSIDYAILERMVDWYIDRGVAGLFAVCQSSEMWVMSLEERLELASFVVKKAAGRVPVMASGHIADQIAGQIDELQQLADTGIQALVLVSNRLAEHDESDDVFKSNLDRILDALPPSMPLGFYECPYPYKRLLSPALMQHCEQTERVYFLKDTSCEIEDMRAKMAAVNGRLKIFNANAATLYESLKIGISGYSGVMANFHPELYVWGVEHYRQGGELVEEAFDMMGFASLVERQLYPVNAKYHMQLEGVPLQLFTRVTDPKRLSSSERMEIEQLHRVVSRLTQRLYKT